MRIPVNFKKLSIEQFSIFLKVQEKYANQLNTIEYKTELAAKLSGHTVEYLESISIRELQNKYIHPVNRLIESSTRKFKINKTIWIKGQRFVACRDEKDLNVNQATVLKEFQKRFTDSIHLILAALYNRTPMLSERLFDASQLNDTADLFLKNLKVKDFYGYLFFFSNLLAEKNESLAISSMMARAEVEAHFQVEVLPWLHELGINTDGSLSSIHSQVEAMQKKKGY